MGFENRRKAQVAIDFLISYGIALLIIGIALLVIYQIGILNPTLSPVQCVPVPGFSCGFFYINSSGIITINLAQDIGTQVTINGAACSTTYTLNSLPQYGNLYVTSNSQYYPPSNDPSGDVMYSSSNTTIRMNCYSGPGDMAGGQIGNLFFGHIWINFTIPQYGRITESVATVTAKYE